MDKLHTPFVPPITISLAKCLQLILLCASKPKEWQTLSIMTLNLWICLNIKCCIPFSPGWSGLMSPLSRRHSIACRFPWSAARCNGAFPILLGQFTSTLSSRSNLLMTSMLLLLIAVRRGVSPSLFFWFITAFPTGQTWNQKEFCDYEGEFVYSCL